MTAFSRFALALLPLLAAIGFLVAVPGCGSRSTTSSTGPSTKVAENPWPKVESQLRKDTSLASCRGVLSQLNTDLALNPDPQFQPANLSTDQEPTLRKLLNLTEAEVKEIRSPVFSNLDPHYLAECLYLRDVAQSLDAGSLPAAQKAELAFGWVCRQVVLNPWVRFEQSGISPMPPVPNTYVLRRGSGSALERVYVFLAVLQQLGIEGCLIGPPEAASRGWTYTARSKGLPTGPFWAVGARSGADILIFDPWTGLPIPGPSGRAATLAQVKADPGLIKQTAEEKERGWDLTPELVKSATPFLAVPLSALAPRMRRLEKELQGSGAPKLAVEPIAVRDRFTTETKLADVSFWNPTREPMGANESFTVTRSLSTFLPQTEGGVAPDNVLFALYSRGSLPGEIVAMVLSSQFPPEQLAALFPPRLRSVLKGLLPQRPGDIGVPEAIRRIGEFAADWFARSFLSDPTPRERIQRGQFAEVMPGLVESRDRFTDAQQRLRVDQQSRAEALRVWSEKARTAYTELSAARAEQASNPGRVVEAMQATDQLWRAEQGVTGALRDAVVAEVGLAEAKFLLAQCMHEMAERSQTRYERLAGDARQQAAMADRVKSDWAEAAGSWDRYMPHAEDQNRAFPGRADHAKRLAERARKMARTR